MRRKLGELLIEQRGATAEDVAEALAQQEAGDPSRLGDLLVATGRVTELARARALAAQFELPFVELSQVSPEVAALVPMSFQVLNRMVPFRAEGPTGSIHLAVADPSTREVLSDLEFQIGRPLVVFVAAGDEIDAVHRALSGEVAQPVLLEEDDDDALADAPGPLGAPGAVEEWAVASPRAIANALAPPVITAERPPPPRPASSIEEVSFLDDPPPAQPVAPPVAPVTAAVAEAPLEPEPPAADEAPAPVAVPPAVMPSKIAIPPEPPRQPRSNAVARIALKRVAVRATGAVVPTADMIAAAEAEVAAIAAGPEPSSPPLRAVAPLPQSSGAMGSASAEAPTVKRQAQPTLRLTDVTAPNLELPEWMRESAPPVTPTESGSADAAPGSALELAVAAPGAAVAVARLMRLLISKGLLTEAEVLAALEKK